MRVLIAAGGTAGHINPALAIAGALKKRHPDAEIHFAGRQKGMEYGLVSKAGYAFHPIEVNGIQRRLTPKNIARNLVALWHLALSGPRADAILREVKPDLVIGAGGYVSGPVVQAAARRGIRTAIHEQNAFPGVTNKILAKQVDLVFAAMPDAVQRLGAPDKTVVTGNPVREEMFRQDRPAARRALGIDHSPKFIIREYIDNMPEMLAAADLVISRAGALTLAEIAAVGRASVLIPSPNVAENHQYHNAMQLQKLGAAVVVEEKELTGEKLIGIVDKLTKDPAELMLMGAKARALAQPDSLDKICENLDRLMKTTA